MALVFVYIITERYLNRYLVAVFIFMLFGFVDIYTMPYMVM